MSAKWLYPIWCLVVILVISSGYVFVRYCWRPFGHREAYLRIIDSTLQNYAHNNGGRFPQGNSSDALQALYPEYLRSGAELAGLTGDIPAVTDALQKSQPISNITSWNYVPNLRIDDDPRLAILWESRFRVSAGGRLTIHNTRPVLLIDQSITNVSKTDWSSFWQHQKHLQEAAWTKREDHGK